MMKFFRKYTKHLLAIFMALLLVVWLGGTALTNIFSPDRDFGEEKIAEIFGAPVLQKELQHTNAETDIAASLGLWWNQPWRTMLLAFAQNEMMFNQLSAQIRTEPLSLEEWYMLDQEARHNGVYVSAEAVNQLKAQLDPQRLTGIRDHMKLSVQDIDTALQSYLRVQQAVEQGARAAKVSEADIQDFVRETAEKVRVGLVTINAASLIDNTYEPTEEELKAQFEKHKDQPPGVGGRGAYGYQMPEAVQVEFIEINVEELAKGQTVSDDEAYTYWQGHKNEFLKPVPPPATTAPTTQTRPSPQPYETFTEAKPKVREKLQRDKAKGAATQIAYELIRQLNRSWANQPTTQPENYKQPPPDEMPGTVYDDLVKSMEAKYGSALVYGRTLLADARELQANPKLGRASVFPQTPNQVPLSEVAFLVQGLEAERGEDPNLTRLFRNLYETCVEPVVDYAGNAYVFRTVAARPKQAPASWEEVRDDLVRDLRNMRAYEEAGRIANDLAERARQQGLKEAFQSDAELAQRLENAFDEPPAFPRQQLYPYIMPPRLMPASIRGVGSDPELIDLCFSLGERAATQPAAKVGVHEQESRQRWVVVEWYETIPVTREEYEQQRQMGQAYATMQMQFEFLGDWFDPQNLRARTGWKEVLQKAPAETEPDKASEEPAKAAS